MQVRVVQERRSGMLKAMIHAEVKLLILDACSTSSAPIAIDVEIWSRQQEYVR